MQNTNSLTVYYNDILPNLPKKQKRVAEAIELLNQATCYQVARFLNVFPHQISGRFSELKKKGIIKIVGTKMQDNRPHAIYSIAADINQETN